MFMNPNSVTGFENYSADRLIKRPLYIKVFTYFPFYIALSLNNIWIITKYIFRALSNIYDGVFYEIVNGLKLSAILLKSSS